MGSMHLNGAPQNLADNYRLCSVFVPLKISVKGTVLLTTYAFSTTPRFIPVNRSICRTDRPFSFSSRNAVSRFSLSIFCSCVPDFSLRSFLMISSPSASEIRVLCSSSKNCSLSAPALNVRNCSLPPVIPNTSSGKYCHDRGLFVAWSELEPGDLVFWVNKKCEGCHRWKEIHHVGIYVGEGKVVEASSSKGCVVVRDLWQTKNYPIIMFGRPYQ